MTAIPDFLKAAVSCPECRRLMIRTVSGWWSCPVSHGRLLTADVMEERIVAALKRFPACRLSVRTVLLRLESIERDRLQREVLLAKRDLVAPGRPRQLELTESSS